MQEKLRVLDLFAGAGGFTMAGEMSGGYTTIVMMALREAREEATSD